MANYNAYNNQMFNPYAVNVPQYQQPIQPMQQQPVIQQGGFIPVSSEREAADYLVAQGTSVTFIDGKNQKMYVKTRGFSPVEQPSFRKFNLVEITESEITPENEKPTNNIEYAEKSEIQALRGEIERINGEIKKLSEVKENE